ncbi:hypothetical protein SDC9_105819 [bioreactor metagenome]|uniref:Uncharacterized protein n=1 Tax=bioreactor metagenome TaxID=1076179 RepID=A0A645B755_9ZZZZ
MIRNDHKPGHKDGRLQEGGQAQADNLLAPLDKAIHISPRDAEHIQGAHRNLNEQDAASLEIGKENFDHGIAHHNDDEQHHDRTGDAAQPAEYAGTGRFLRRPGRVELVNDLRRQRVDTAAVTGDPRGQAGLQADGEFEQLHRHRRKQADGKKSFERVEQRLFRAAASVLIVDAGFKCGYHEANSEERPAKVVEKEDDGLHPRHIEKLHAHVAHLRKEVAQEADHLAVDPVDDLIHHVAK